MDNIKNQKQAESFKITGDWKEQSKQLKTKYPKLTDEDLRFETGKESDLLKRVESKLGRNRDEVIKIIKNEQPNKL